MGGILLIRVRAEGDRVLPPDRLVALDGQITGVAADTAMADHRSMSLD